MTKSLLVLLGLASLPLFGGCTGEPGDTDDTGTNPDDTGSGWAATIRITLPSDTPDGAEVMVNGDVVPSCGLESKECIWTATEAGDYEVEVQCDGLYFATQFANVQDDGQTVDLTWQKGGCSDPEWSVGDGQCADDEGNSLWVDGQYGCDLTGFWKGVEDEVHDVRGDIVMTTTDLDGDGVYEASLDGGDDDEDIGAFVASPVNIGGTIMNVIAGDSAWVNAEMDSGSCGTLIRVVDQFGEYHMELYEE